MIQLCLTSFFAFFCLLPSLYAADAGTATSTSVVHSPAKNGYIANVTFKYVFRNCYGELHLNIDRQEITASSYRYEGRNYSPTDLGLSSFENPRVGLINLWADIYDKGSRVGELKMSTVTKNSGGGCFGQTYGIGKTLKINDKEAAKRAEDFSARGFRMETSSTDSKIEAMIKKKLAPAPVVKDDTKQKPTDDAKKSGSDIGTVGAATGSVSATAAGSTSTGTSGATNATGTTPSAKVSSPTNQKLAQSKDAPTNVQANNEQQKIEQAKKKQREQIQQFQKQQEQRNKEIDRDAKQAAKKIGNAAQGFYSGIQGSNSAAGISMRIGETTDEQEPYWLGMTFGKYWNPNNYKTQKKWISAVEFEFAFNTEWLDSVVKSFYPIRTKNWKRYSSGFFLTLVTNITTFGTIQPFITVGQVDFETYGLSDEKLGTGSEFTTGYGIAFNLDGAALVKIGQNSKLETTNISFGFMF